MTRAVLAALAVAFTLGCPTLRALEDPGPVTEGDRVALDAMVKHGAALLADGELGADDSAEWVEHLVGVYTAIRFSAGLPIFPEPGETPHEAALREALAEVSASGYEALEREDWVKSAVRVYAGWRFATGDPIPLAKPPPEGEAASG